MERLLAATWRRAAAAWRVRSLAAVVLVGVLACMALDLKGVELAFAAGGLAVGYGLVELAWRTAAKRQIERQASVFAGYESILTVTDEGLLVESPRTRSASYHAWQLLARPQLDSKGGTISICICGPDMVLAFPLHGLDDGQRRELLQELQARAGKQGGPMPPPLDASRAHPLDITPAQRAEAYDMMAARNPSWIRLLSAVLLPCLGWQAGDMLGCQILADSTDSGLLGVLGITVVIMALLAANLLHPGRHMLRAASTAKARRTHCKAYLFDTEERRMLALGREDSWAVCSLDQIECMGRGKTCRLVFTRGQALGLTLPLDAELPPGLPAEQPLPRRSRLAWPAILLAAVLCAVAACLAQGEGCDCGEYGDEAAEEMYDEVAAPICDPIND